VPISYGQIFSGKGGNMIYVIDKAAAKKVLENADRIGQRGVDIKNVSDQAASKKVEDLTFFRNPDSGLIG
jgi:hypothetical protein